MKRKLFLIAGMVGTFIGASVLVAYGVSVLSSQQVGTSPVAGSVLQTNGVTSTWVPTSSLGISGGPGGGLGTTTPFITGNLANVSSSGAIATYGGSACPGGQAV